MAGFVYVMSNSGFDGRLKIGKSIKDPTGDRLVELNSSTSTPEPFKVEYYCYVDQFHKLEARVHKHLENNRPNKQREFFQVDLQKAVTTIREIAKELGGIKFEESYFVENEVMCSHTIEKAQDTRLEENLLDNYPKAVIVLRYNYPAMAAYRTLAGWPVNVIKSFLSVLENQPNINADELKALFEEPEYKKYFQPFEDPIASYYYERSLSESIEMALDFKHDFELMQPTVSARNIFEILCESYSVEISAEDSFGITAFHSCAQKISNLKSVSLNYLKLLFAEIGLNISLDQNGYVLTREGIEITDIIQTRDTLLSMMQSHSLVSLWAGKKFDIELLKQNLDQIKTSVGVIKKSANSRNSEWLLNTLSSVGYEIQHDETNQIFYITNWRGSTRTVSGRLELATYVEQQIDLWRRS